MCNKNNRIYESFVDVIGYTPLVRIPFDIPCPVYAKLEHLNPGGSIKDRSALYMIQMAEKRGLLKPGGVIIEASSGNQGIATAMIAKAKGYRVIITVSEKVSEEKKKTLQAYGVEMIVCKATKHLNDPESYHSCAMRLHKSMPGSFMLNQYFNPDNAAAHYEFLGHELWNQIGHKMTHFVAATGSAGTASGAGKYLKEMNSNIKVIGVDSACSYWATSGKPTGYVLEGMGIDYETPLFDKTVIDDMYNVTDVESIAMLKTLARQYGFLVGPASGGAAVAAYNIAKNLTKDDFLVTVFTDSGRAYLSKNFYHDASDDLAIGYAKSDIAKPFLEL